MLQGSPDGHPAAPASLAEALSFQRQKKHPSGCFFYAWNLPPQTPQIQMWERACSRRGRVSQLRWRLTHRLREQARSHKGLRWRIDRGHKKSTPQGASFLIQRQQISEPSDSPTRSTCLPYPPESGCLDHDPCAPCLPCRPANNARRNLQPCH
ncbi:hypothetical protein D3C85_1307710 [compost metagenome]